MNYYKVIFLQNGKVPYTKKFYTYKSKLALQVGAIYNIEADYRTTYDNPIRVEEKEEDHETGVATMNLEYFAFRITNVREITKATLLDAPSRPKSPIKKVIFNEEKLTTVVLWTDGTKTILKKDPYDTFDKEKAIALAFMKRWSFDNRSCFNEELKKWTQQGD